MNLAIFDCDGVLIDSEIISCSCAAAFVTAAGYPIDTGEIVSRFVGTPRSAMLRQLQAESGLSFAPDLEMRLSAAVIARFESELRPIDGVGSAIVALGIPVCVASGSDVDYIRRALALTGLRHLFDDSHLFSSRMVARGKPAPDVFLHAAAAMGADPTDCVVVEDSLVGVQAALAAGMKVLGFTGGAHHAASPAAARLRDAGAHRVFGAMKELPGLLRAL